MMCKLPMHNPSGMTMIYPTSFLHYLFIFYIFNSVGRDEVMRDTLKKILTQVIK